MHPLERADLIKNGKITSLFVILSTRQAIEQQRSKQVQTVVNRNNNDILRCREIGAVI